MLTSFRCISATATKSKNRDKGKTTKADSSGTEGFKVEFWTEKVTGTVDWLKRIFGPNCTPVRIAISW